MLVLDESIELDSVDSVFSNEVKALVFSKTSIVVSSVADSEVVSRSRLVVKDSVIVSGLIIFGVDDLSVEVDGLAVVVIEDGSIG